MNLTKSELVAFLGILIKKNPVIDLQIETPGSIKVKHFNGLENVIELPEVTTSNVIEHIYSVNETEDQTDYKELSIYYDQDIDLSNQLLKLETKLDEYMTSLPEEVIEEEKVDIEHLITELLEKKFSESETHLELDLDKMKTSLLNQITSISENVVSDAFKKHIETIPEPIVPEIPDIPSILSEFYISLKSEMNEMLSTVEKSTIVEQHMHPVVEYDDNKLREELKQFVEDNKQIVETVVPVNYTYLENFITTKIEELQKTLEHNSLKAVTGIENRRNRIILSYSDNTIADITDILIPLVKMHIPSIRGQQAIGGMGGGGGGSKGDPGLSAYQIAVTNGFVGTESEWLASLSGGASIPLPGSINRDIDGTILSVTKGSVTTYINRDVNGDIINIEAGSYRTVFERDVSGQITGWSVENV